MILADTSAWVEFDRATGSPADLTLSSLVSKSADLAVTEPVLMEVMAGARDDAAAASLRRLLTSFQWIPADAQVDFEGAARVYRLCRAAGVTPRGLTDCMIATIAMRSGAELLAADRDFESISRVVPLRIAGT